MRPRALAVVAMLLIAACGEHDLGRRYWAERAFLRANQSYHRLSAAPRRTNDNGWSALAGEYAAIAARCLPASDSAARPTTPVQRELQEIAARALFTAAQIHAALLDSVRVDQIFQQMATQFAGLPSIAGEASLSRGRIAESNGERDRAIAHYARLVQQFQPRPGEPGIAGSVLPLPLRIARLTAQSAADPGDSTHYAKARQTYRRLVADSTSANLVVGARGHLADIAMDLGQWAEAAQILQRLEVQLKHMDAPPRDPAEVRYAAVSARMHLHASLASMRADIESLITDYPSSEMAPRALHALAEETRRQGRLEEALSILDRLIGVDESEKVIPDAMLAKGQLLDSMDRWKEAIIVYRSLTSGFPLSLAALRSHLEIADHYLRAGNNSARMEALDQAQRAYREFLDRYPANPYTYRARELLIRTLTLQERHQEALEEMLAFSESVSGSSKEPQLLIEAARMAVTQLADTSRAVAILEQAAQRFPKTRIGTWSSHEADRLRQGLRP